MEIYERKNIFYRHSCSFASGAANCFSFRSTVIRRGGLCHDKSHRSEVVVRGWVRRHICFCEMMLLLHRVRDFIATRTGCHKSCRMSWQHRTMERKLREDFYCLRAHYLFFDLKFNPCEMASDAEGESWVIVEKGNLNFKSRFPASIRKGKLKELAAAMKYFKALSLTHSPRPRNRSPQSIANLALRPPPNGNLERKSTRNLQSKIRILRN